MRRLYGWRPNSGWNVATQHDAGVAMTHYDSVSDRACSMIVRLKSHRDRSKVNSNNPLFNELLWRIRGNR